MPHEGMQTLTLFQTLVSGFRKYKKNHHVDRLPIKEVTEIQYNFHK